METQNIANPSSTAASPRPTGTSSRSSVANTRSTMANTRSSVASPRSTVANTRSAGRPALRNLPHPRSNSNRDSKRLEINPKPLKTSHFTKS